MADIDVGPLTDSLEDDEITELGKDLEKLGVKKLPSGDASNAATLATLDDDVLQELLDRLDDYDAACDIYVPAEFEGQVDAGDYKVGSIVALLDALEEVREELALDEDGENEEEDEDEDEDEDDDDEDEDDDDDDVSDDDEEAEEEYAKRAEMEERVKRAWQKVRAGAQAARQRQLSLFLRIG
jgi:hypothetical protein